MAALLEWNLAPPRRANTIVMTDRRQRAARVSTTLKPRLTTEVQIGVWLGDSYLEITTANGRDMQTLGDPTAVSPTSSSGHRLDYFVFGLDVSEIETCYELGKELQLSSQYDQRNHAALRWAMRDDSLCEA